MTGDVTIGKPENVYWAAAWGGHLRYQRFPLLNASRSVVGYIDRHGQDNWDAVSVGGRRIPSGPRLTGSFYRRRDAIDAVIANRGGVQ